MPVLPKAALDHMSATALAHLPNEVATETDITSGGTFVATDAVDYFVFDFDAAVPQTGEIHIEGFDPAEDRLVFENFADTVYIGTTYPAPSGSNIYEAPLTVGDGIVHVSFSEIHVLEWRGSLSGVEYFATIDLGAIDYSSDVRSMTYSQVTGGIDYLMFTSGDFTL